MCSTSTVKLYLRRNGLFGRVAAKKPLLNSKQRKRRLQWCRERRSWNSTDWRKNIFSDECKLDMHNCTRIYIRRRVGERLKEKKLNPTVKFSRSINHGLECNLWWRKKNSSLVSRSCLFNSLSRHIRYCFGKCLYLTPCFSTGWGVMPYISFDKTVIGKKIN